MRKIRFDRDDVVPILIMIVAVGIFLWIAYGLLMQDATAAPVEPKPFDHSNCQYPNRASNPPDGCDNSDPARPECMKIGLEDCDLPYMDGSTPISQAPAAPAPSHEVVTPPTVVNCTESK